MKKIFVSVLFFLSTLKVFSQDTLYVDFSNLDNFKKNKFEPTYLKFQDGTLLSVGDEIGIGFPSMQTNFRFMMLGKMALAGMAGTIAYLPEHYKEKITTINKVKVEKGKKYNNIILYLNNPGNLNITVFDFLSALQYNELMLLNIER
jgi:hypothetical protein